MDAFAACRIGGPLFCDSDWPGSCINWGAASTRNAGAAPWRAMSPRRIQPLNSPELIHPLEETGFIPHEA
jgi:hypothetical protein